MIEPTCYDIYIPKGATYDQTFTWKDDSGHIYDLSAYTARMQIRVTVTAPDPPIISLTTENDGITLTSTDPNISLFISDTDTSSVTISSGVYDLELKAPDNTVIRLLQGKVTFSPNVTK
jgi:hypothetical protein